MLHISSYLHHILLPSHAVDGKRQQFSFVFLDTRDTFKHGQIIVKLLWQQDDDDVSPAFYDLPGLSHLSLNLFSGGTVLLTNLCDRLSQRTNPS